MHGSLHPGHVREKPRIERDVAVLGCFRESNLDAAGSQIDRLGPNDDDGMALLGKGVERIQQGRPSTDQQVGAFIARRFHCVSSNPGVRLPRRVPDQAPSSGRRPPGLERPQ